MCTVAVHFAWPSRRAVLGIDGLPTPPMRTETAVRRRIDARARETQPDRATRRRRQTSRAPTAAADTSAAIGEASEAESASVLKVVKDASSTSGELASAGSEHVHGVRNAGAGDPQRIRPWGRRGGGAPPGHMHTPSMRMASCSEQSHEH